MWICFFSSFCMTDAKGVRALIVHIINMCCNIWDCCQIRVWNKTLTFVYVYIRVISYIHVDPQTVHLLDEHFIYKDSILTYFYSSFTFCLDDRVVGRSPESAVSSGRMGVSDNFLCVVQFWYFEMTLKVFWNKSLDIYMILMQKQAWKCGQIYGALQCHMMSNLQWLVGVLSYYTSWATNLQLNYKHTAQYVICQTN